MRAGTITSTTAQVWLRNGDGDFIFDVGADWPAPGFQLGFGRIGHFGDVNYLADADGTIHHAVILSEAGPSRSWL